MPNFSYANRRSSRGKTYVPGSNCSLSTNNSEMPSPSQSRLRSLETFSKGKIRMVRASARVTAPAPRAKTTHIRTRLNTERLYLGLNGYANRDRYSEDQ